MTRRSRLATALAIAALAALAALGCGLVSASPAAASVALRGTFMLTPGSCSGGAVSGTYLRMILPSGGVNGPYMSNSDSRCKDQSYTALSAGTDGGLVSGSYQPTPQPPFDKNGNALAGRITAPSPFYGTSFATSSNASDPQTKRSVPVPQVYANGSTLTADLRAFSVTWNSQYFNQGSPKPDGSYPGNTKPAHGTYDASTGAFTLDWTSQVVGGPFDKFTGQWHLAGRFVPAAGGSGPVNTAPGGTNSGSQPGAQSGGTVHASATAGGTGRPDAAASAVTVKQPLAGGTAAAASNGAANPAAQQVAASTTTVTKDKWRVAWWVIVLTAALAIAGFATIAWLNRTVRAAGGR